MYLFPEMSFRFFFKDQITQFAAAFFSPMQRTVSADVL